MILNSISLNNTYALKNKKVIIVDLDLRKPKVHKLFEILPHGRFVFSSPFIYSIISLYSTELKGLPIELRFLYLGFIRSSTEVIPISLEP